MKVSVGLPFYNNEDTLEDAVHSVYMQTYTDWELILVDDGSTDRSLDLAQAMAKHDPRIRLFHDGLHTNLSTRLNQIARLAHGQYLARMDADDMMHPERLELQIQYMDENPTVDLLGTGIFVLGTGDKLLGCNYFGTNGNTLDAILNHRLIMHPTILGRTAWFQDHPYDEKLQRNQAEELWCRSYHETQFDNLKIPLLFYRTNSLVDKRSNYYKVATANERSLCKCYGGSLGRCYVFKFLIKSHLKDLVYDISTSLHVRGMLYRNLIMMPRLKQHNNQRAEILELIQQIKRVGQIRQS